MFLFSSSRMPSYSRISFTPSNPAATMRFPRLLPRTTRLGTSSVSSPVHCTPFFGQWLATVSLGLSVMLMDSVCTPSVSSLTMERPSWSSSTGRDFRVRLALCGKKRSRPLVKMRISCVKIFSNPLKLDVSPNGRYVIHYPQHSSQFILIIL